MLNDLEILIIGKKTGRVMEMKLIKEIYDVLMRLLNFIRVRIHEMILVAQIGMKDVVACSQMSSFFLLSAQNPHLPGNLNRSVKDFHSERFPLFIHSFVFRRPSANPVLGTQPKVRRR